MPEEILGHCWNCGQGLSKSDLGRETTCGFCDKPTHCCRNCRHYAPGRANECMEPNVDRVVDKLRANFCDLFEPSLRAHNQDGSANDPEALRHAAEALFKP
jgi:hypothetical protein